MNCWHCNSKLIWGGDHLLECEDGKLLLETNLSCPDCDAQVLVCLEPKVEVERGAANDE